MSEWYWNDFWLMEWHQNELMSLESAEHLKDGVGAETKKKDGREGDYEETNSWEESKVANIESPLADIEKAIIIVKHPATLQTNFIPVFLNA